jgi:hypothetical protein
MMENGSKISSLGMESYIIKILMLLVSPFSIRILTMLKNCGQNIKDHFQKIVKTAEEYSICLMGSILKEISSMTLHKVKESTLL